MPRWSRDPLVSTALGGTIWNVKKCSKCGAEKLLDAYYRQADCRDGRRPDCKECVLAARRAEKAERPERVKAREKARYQRHAERRKAESRAYYAMTRERQIAYRRAHYEMNKDAYAGYSQKRKALLRGVEHTPYTRTEIYERDGGRCRGCQQVLAHDNFEIDHIVPLALGGPDTPANLQLMCKPCNRTKWMNLEGQIHLPV